MLPRVFISNLVSLDGRIEGFPADPTLYYTLSAQSGADTHLTGADTLLSGDDSLQPDGEGEYQGPEPDPDDPRPLLVVTDSRGRVRHWQQLRTMPYWRDQVALCSRATPAEHLDYLRRSRVHTIIAGEDKVDLRAALEELADRFGSRLVHADSGGTLNAALLAAGLVQEVSLLVYPYLVGGDQARPLFRFFDPAAKEGPLGLRLTHVEQFPDNILWLRYEVESRT
ncbi:MAG: dihydrofolate reductase family protein [Anaerolineae bacterium]|jgi:2,5-diamino-6-(ribosylamino)-4(3H)-pyrimidinone 5'-phosphate reductase